MPTPFFTKVFSLISFLNVLAIRLPHTPLNLLTLRLLEDLANQFDEASSKLLRLLISTVAVLKQFQK
jgi:hypothetical protein